MKKLFYALSLMLVLVSCNKQEIIDCNNNLVIYLNNQSITRSALANDPSQVENNVNTITVGVFAADGTVKTIKDFASIGNSKQISMRVLNLSNTDKVVCAVNVKPGLFFDVKTLQDFNSKEISLDNTVSKNGVDLSADNLFMYGESPITLSGDTYIAKVDVYHLNTKVTLNKMDIQIANNGTFTVREIFIANAPSSIKTSYVNPYTNTNYYHGSLNSQITGETQKLYLGYGNINTTIDKLYFYTSPNNSDKYTKLVIAGMYDADGNGPSQQKMTYYPIVIDKQLLPNRNYILNVSVKGPGIDNPNGDLNYSNLNISINVKDFENQTKDISLD